MASAPQMRSQLQPGPSPALAPAATDALFYVVTDRSGRHAFARTLEEHERNIADAVRRGIL